MKSLSFEISGKLNRLTNTNIKIIDAGCYEYGDEKNLETYFTETRDILFFLETSIIKNILDISFSKVNILLINGRTFYYDRRLLEDEIRSRRIGDYRIERE